MLASRSRAAACCSCSPRRPHRWLTAPSRRTAAAATTEDAPSTSRQDAWGLLPAAGLLAAASLVAPDAAQALSIHTEPANALSLPTWAIHVSSVAEWVLAMRLMWQYAEVSGNPRWKGMTWGMMPALGSAMAACTWHFFYNSPDLDFLVALQAFLTVVGNCTCMWAAYRIYAAAQAESASS